VRNVLSDRKRDNQSRGEMRREEKKRERKLGGSERQYI
jgi:hypothetical protein